MSRSEPYDPDRRRQEHYNYESASMAATNSHMPISSNNSNNNPNGYQTTLGRNIMINEQRKRDLSSIHGSNLYSQYPAYQVAAAAGDDDGRMGHTYGSNLVRDYGERNEPWREDFYHMEDVRNDDCDVCCIFFCCQIIATCLCSLGGIFCKPKYESLRRAICFGAIDGILTGSGVVSATVGFRLFPHLYFSMMSSDYSPTMKDLNNDYRTDGVFASGTFTQQAWALVILTFAACCADGLCMGVGHVWSSYVLHDGANKERQDVALLYQTQRMHSKANLLDMLMARGMMKLDAIKIVDILEGYPDIFVSASLGDVNGTGPLGIAGDDNMYASDSSVEHDLPHKRVNSGMGRFNAFSDSDYADDAMGTCGVIAESINEGLVMSIAFCFASIIPALIHIFVPLYLNALYDGANVDYANEGLHPTTLTMSLLILVMFLLGFWKSKFFEANYIVFGIEAALVLLLCIFSALFIGSGLRLLVCQQ